MTDSIRYATVKDVAFVLNEPVGQLQDHIADEAQRRLEAATESWIRETKTPFHPTRRGRTDEPHTWEQHDGRNINGRSPPILINLDRSGIIPIGREAGDRIEVRVGRDTYRDVTDRQGKEWTIDHRRGQLKLYRILVRRTVFERPEERVLRLTYRHQSLDHETEVTETGVVEGVPQDVRQAVAARAAIQLVTDDVFRTSMPDDGQLNDPSTRVEQLRETWQERKQRYIDARVV